MLTRVVRFAGLCAVLVVPLIPAVLPAQNVHPTPSPETRAVPLQAGEIHVDGKLDEPVWQSAQPATDFRQNQPREGEPATQRTEVRFAYDDAAIYVGARMFDTEGAKGVRTQLVRRDGDFSSDYVQVIFDTYHDHIGRLFFLVNPSGVKSDANGLGGGGDNSWDPVWEVKTTIDSLGWTAEMRIPFSQLRYPATQEEQTWGVQIWRQENRLNENSQWSFWGLQETGGPPRFGHLHGIVIRSAPGKAEVLPYLVGRSANTFGDPSDPFFDPHAMDGRFGADATLRVTSNLTLNATVNPDFGQVEVDPAVVNLSAFETSFSERRPFFVEGAGYFGLGGLSCYFCSNVSSLSMISTRRIGRSPQISPFRAGVVVPVEFADMPENSTILGAAKLTGRTRTGWSIGALNAVTRRESAPVQFEDSSRGSFTVEPLTNYFASRIAKDLRGGATQLRMMATSVYRNLNEPYLQARLTSHSEALGFGTDMYFKKRTYRLMAQLAGTNVAGDTAALRRIRFSSAHFFNRPDRSDPVDAMRPRTSMQGLGGYARFSHESGKLLWELSSNFRSPAFNNNDITFFSRADYWYVGGNIFPQWTKPTKWYRSAYLIGGAQTQSTFDGDVNGRQFHVFGQIQTRFYWWISTFLIHQPSVFDDRLTRGGPVVRRPSGDFWNMNVSSDGRKRIVANFGADRGCNADHYCNWDSYVSLDLKPRSNVTLSFGPSYSYGESGTQLVGSYADAGNTAFYGRRYVFGELVQKSLSMDTRLNITFSPTLTLELFMQPLIFSGAFGRYSEFTTPRSVRRQVYGEDMGTMTVNPAPPDTNRAAIITVDADGAGTAPAFTFNDPSFTFRSLRGNAVLRWEYRPGSTLFLVWTRSGESSLFRGNLMFGDDFRSVFQGPSENIFLVKLNFWLGF